MWEYRGGTDDGDIQHLDLVLIDSEGNAMYAEIPAAEVELKRPLLQEGGVYVMSRFRVSNAKSYYRPVDMQYMIEFTCYTKITPAEKVPSGFPTITYSLVPLPELPGYRGENKKFLDAMGIVTKVSESALVHLSNQPAPTQCRDIFIRDLSNFEMKVTLWGHRALQFNIDAVRAQGDAAPLVVLFVGTLMKAFSGEEYLSGNAACRWYFNPDIPEAKEFYTMLRGQRIDIVRLPGPSQQGHQQAVPPAQIEHKQLRDLKDISPYDFPANGYRCTVTIVRLVPGVSWWFPSCNKCSKACVPDGSGYRCNICLTTGFKFKYKLCFIASDGSAEAEMIAFGDVARRIIGKPVQVVLRASRYSDDIPPDVAAVVSLRFTFGIGVTEQSYYKPEKSYLVNTIITPYGRQPALPRLIGGGQSSSSAGASLGRGAAPATPQNRSVVIQQELDITPGASDVSGAVDALENPNQTTPAEAHTAGAPVKTNADSDGVGATKARKRLFMDNHSSEELDPLIDDDLDDSAHTTVPDGSGKMAKRDGMGKGVLSDAKASDVKLPRARKAK